MTPTLFDVYDILRLAVDGQPVTYRPISDLHEFIEDNLGIVPIGGNLTTIKHSWLKANFRGLPPNASPVEIVRYTRAYLLFLISVTIFVDASVATVPTRYLQFFKYIEQASRYEWCCNPRISISFTWKSLYFQAKTFQWFCHSYADIEVDTANGLALEEYKAWYNRVSHLIIHNVANPPIDILQPRNQEEEEVVPAHEPQYIMRPLGYEDELVSAFKASIIMLAEALTQTKEKLGWKYYNVKLMMKLYNNKADKM
ncbi:hypothetical protein AMTR_s00025p00129710 [Amborella trichopoda]|uniref:Aminotransferase-like plant mobile domain-containing protein n=1 Tax=Amborella trichopoda TaxID=13333 RepID=W1PWA1_AMBTC|nr:hypothetical protein AMTR_s00025p00129710 [Amborella trichopoda]